MKAGKLVLKQKLLWKILILICLLLITTVLAFATLQRNNLERIQKTNNEIEQIRRENEELKRQLKEAQDATTFNQDKLLEYTNTQRTLNNVAPLSLRQYLNASAKLKAENMVAENYWSHVSPAGTEPWVFMDQVGYKYTKAGENLAYGYLTGPDTIIGWMNSPSHKSNMLDPAFRSVGFGVLRNVKYQAGTFTVVVAHYAKP